MQLSKILDLNIPAPAEKMNYQFEFEPSRRQKQLTWWLREIGHSPYRVKQPNGWSDFEVDWVSPELLLRRLWFASTILPNFIKRENNGHEFILKCLEKNFDDHSRIAALIENYKFDVTKKDIERKYGIICNLPGVLKV